MQVATARYCTRRLQFSLVNTRSLASCAKSLLVRTKGPPGLSRRGVKLICSTLRKNRINEIDGKRPLAYVVLRAGAPISKQSAPNATQQLAFWQTKQQLAFWQTKISQPGGRLRWPAKPLSTDVTGTHTACYQMATSVQEHVATKLLFTRPCFSLQAS